MKAGPGGTGKIKKAGLRPCFFFFLTHPTTRRQFSRVVSEKPLFYPKIKGSP